MSGRGARWQLQRAIWALTPPVLLPLVRRGARRLGLAAPAAPAPVVEAAPAAEPVPVPEPAPTSPPPPHWEYVPEGFARTAKGWDVAAISAAYREKWPSFIAAVEGTNPLGVNHEMPRAEDIGTEDLGAHNTIVSFAYVLALAARGARPHLGARLGRRDRPLPARWAARSCRTSRSTTTART